VAAVSSGEITPSEAVEIGRLLENYVRTPEITELGQRLKKLEGIMSNEANWAPYPEAGSHRSGSSPRPLLAINGPDSDAEIA
jgi:hypothetical protein